MSESAAVQAKPPAQVTPPDAHHAASALALQVGVVVIAALYFAKGVLIPITLAILLSFILAPGWQSGKPVLCLAGKGPLDEAASAMLSQLLGKHGLGARMMPHEAASREAIGELDVTGTAMVCISYLDIAGSPSHLRYLMQRLKRRLPGVPILVGLWPSEDEVLTSDRVRAVIGADY